jgi:hypothetical protein
MKTAREVAFNVPGRSRQWREIPLLRRMVADDQRVGNQDQTKARNSGSDGQSVWSREAFCPVSDAGTGVASHGRQWPEVFKDGRQELANRRMNANVALKLCVGHLGIHGIHQ